MKKILLVVLVFISSIAFAQDGTYEKVMASNLTLMHTANSPEEFQKLSDQFEQIANIQKTEWLPYYYAAYCLAEKNHRISDTKEIDKNADKAKSLADKADSLQKNNAEIYCLKSIIVSTRIMADPTLRGPKYGLSASNLIQKAYKLEPDNPRVNLVIGQTKFYAPAIFGGGKDNAKPYFEKSLTLFDTYKPKSEIDPDWGRAEVKYFLEKYD